MKKSKKRLPDCRFDRTDKTNLEEREMEKGQTNQGGKKDTEEHSTPLAGHGKRFPGPELHACYIYGTMQETCPTAGLFAQTRQKWKKGKWIRERQMKRKEGGSATTVCKQSQKALKNVSFFLPKACSWNQ